jgi:hypothetical protein
VETHTDILELIKSPVKNLSTDELISYCQTNLENLGYNDELKSRFFSIIECRHESVNSEQITNNGNINHVSHCTSCGMYGPVCQERAKSDEVFFQQSELLFRSFCEDWEFHLRCLRRGYHFTEKIYSLTQARIARWLNLSKPAIKKYFTSKDKRTSPGGGTKRAIEDLFNMWKGQLFVIRKKKTDTIKAELFHEKEAAKEASKAYFQKGFQSVVLRWQLRIDNRSDNQYFDVNKIYNPDPQKKLIPIFF